MSECTEDDVYVKAHEKRLFVVKPKVDELLLDIDHHGDELHMHEMVELLSDNGIEIEIVRDAPSNGGNRHVTCKLPGLFKESMSTLDEARNQLTRVALEAALGSDRKRTLLGLLTILLKKPGTPSCFFERREDVTGAQILEQERYLIQSGIDHREDSGE